MAHYEFEFTGYEKCTKSRCWLASLNMSRPQLTKKEFDMIMITLTGEMEIHPWDWCWCDVFRDSEIPMTIHAYRIDGEIWFEFFANNKLYSGRRMTIRDPRKEVA